MLSSANRVAGMKTPRFGEDRGQWNDENKVVHSTTTKIKPVGGDSSLLKKSISNKGVEDIPGKKFAKRRVLGDISNRKQPPNNSSALSRTGGKVPTTLAKPFPKKNYSKDESTTERNPSLRKMRIEEQSSRKQQSVILKSSSVKPLQDEETIELPAGRLSGEGPPSTFFDPVCSFELDDDHEEESDKYHKWISMSENHQKGLEQEIRSSDQRLETSLEKLYQDDLSGFLSSLHVSSDVSLLFDEDKPCLKSSWGNHAECWMDDDISL